MAIESTHNPRLRLITHLIGCLGVLVALAMAAGAQAQAGLEPTPAASAFEPPAPTSTRFTYRAFIGGTPAGDVVVDVERSSDQYRVNGRAATTGFWRTIDDWSGDFSADGSLVDGDVIPERYVLIEKSSRKEQHVVVSSGELFVTKNGKARTPKPAHPGIDLVSALWVVADCVDNADLHNGRHGYSVERTQLDDGVCRYDVENDDGDSYSANVRFASHEGYPVLESLVVNRLVGTRLTLIDVEPLIAERSDDAQISGVAAASVRSGSGAGETHDPMQTAPGGDRVADTTL